MIIRVHDNGEISKIPLQSPVHQVINYQTQTTRVTASKSTSFVPRRKFKMFRDAFDKFNQTEDSFESTMDIPFVSSTEERSTLSTEELSQSATTEASAISMKEPSLESTNEASVPSTLTASIAEPPNEVSEPSTLTASIGGSLKDGYGRVKVPDIFTGAVKDEVHSFDISINLDPLDLSAFDMEEREQQRIDDITTVADQRSQNYHPDPLPPMKTQWPPDPNVVNEIPEAKEEEDPVPAKKSKLAQQLWMISGIYLRDLPDDVADTESVSGSVSGSMSNYS